MADSKECLPSLSSFYNTFIHKTLIIKESRMAGSISSAFVFAVHGHTDLRALWLLLFFQQQVSNQVCKHVDVVRDTKNDIKLQLGCYNQGYCKM